MEGGTEEAEEGGKRDGNGRVGERGGVKHLKKVEFRRLAFCVLVVAV